MLCMNVPLYGTKQAAYCFFKTQVHRDLERSFTCKRERELMEYVGSTLTFSHDDNGKRTVKFTQQALIKNINKEYKMSDGPVSKTPAVAGQVLMKGDGKGTISPKQIKMYHSATSTCMFMMQWSHPDISNAVQGLARHMTAPREAHVCALMTLLKYVTHTHERGLVIAPRDLWSTGYKFKVHGGSDSDYAMNRDDRRSILGGRVFVNDVPIANLILQRHSKVRDFIIN